MRIVVSQTAIGQQDTLLEDQVDSRELAFPVAVAAKCSFISAYWPDGFSMRLATFTPLKPPA